MKFFHKHIQLRVQSFLFLMLLYIEVFGQSKVVIQKDDALLNYGVLSYTEQKRVIQDALWTEIEDGYVFAGLDTVYARADSVVFLLERGSQQNWSSTAKAELVKAKKRMKKYLDHGYPFASLKLDSLLLVSDFIEGFFSIDKGPQIVFDTVIVRGESGLSPTYLHAALNFQPGDLYSESKYQNIEKRIAQVRQLELLKRPDIGFSSGKAYVVLDAKGKKSDKFEGILGVLPEEGGQSQITGYLNLDLNNLFKSGKEFHLKWNRFAASSQQLQLSYLHPYLFQSSFKVGVDFTLLRQDSSFVKRDFSLLFRFPLGANIELGLKIASRASDILGTRPDPALGLDYRITDYTPILTFGNFSGNVSLKNFYEIRTSLGIGDKRIIRNQLFDATVYDSVSFRSTNYQIDFRGLVQRKIGKTSAAFLAFQAGILEGSQIVRNEFYRVGGLRSLRGFNENIFFTQRFFKLQSEYRLFFDSKSYLLALVDVGYLSVVDRNLTTYSPGGGLSFATTSGNFEFIFALGAIDSFSFNPQNVKVHFGYQLSF